LDFVFTFRFNCAKAIKFQSYSKFKISCSISCHQITNEKQFYSFSPDLSENVAQFRPVHAMIPRIFALMANFCKITVILGLFALAFLPVACNQCTTGTGNAQKEDRLVPEFSSIDLQCSANVIIRDRVLSETTKLWSKHNPTFSP
jgi:hypothetical protein